MNRIYLLILLLTAWQAPLPAQMVVNGSLGDWESIPALPVEPRDVGHDSLYGAVQELKAAVDPYCLYVAITFRQARPFVNPQVPKQLVEGIYDDFGYLEIDVNGDGQWDFRTQQATGKRAGLNNLAVIGADGAGRPTGRVAYPEGHKNYMPYGARGYFSADGRSLELRLPRGVLEMAGPRVIGLRVRMHYKDARQGSGQWVTEYYPDGNNWINFTCGADLKAGQMAQIKPGSVTLAPNANPEGAVLGADLGEPAENPGTGAPYAIPKINPEQASVVRGVTKGGDRTEATGRAVQEKKLAEPSVAPPPPAETPEPVLGRADAVPTPIATPSPTPVATETPLPAVNATPTPAPEITPGGAFVVLGDDGEAPNQPVAGVAAQATQDIQTTNVTGQTAAMGTPPPIVAPGGKWEIVPEDTPKPAKGAATTPSLAAPLPAAARAGTAALNTPVATPIPVATPTPTATATATPTPTPAVVLTPTPKTQKTLFNAPVAVPGASEPIVLNGPLSGWNKALFANTINPAVRKQAGHTHAELDKIWVAASAGFLYLRLDYPAARGAVPGFLERGECLRLDIDFDGVVDYIVRVRPGEGADAGAKCDILNGTGALLMSSTDMATRSDAPQAAYLAKRHTLALRLPRGPLGLAPSQARLRLQATVAWHPAQNTPWSEVIYPSPASWFVCTLSTKTQ